MIIIMIHYYNFNDSRIIKIIKNMYKCNSLLTSKDNEIEQKIKNCF